jgi:hypothetical protein
MPVTEVQSRLDQFDAQIFLERHGAKPDSGNARAMTFNHLHPTLPCAPFFSRKHPLLRAAIPVKC